MNHANFLRSAALLTALLTQPAWADTFAHDGCQYQGASLHGKPHGQGALTCADGRVYTGAFKNGQFHGKGQYVVPNRHSLMLAPFNMNSDKLRNMVLTGTFVNGLANGKFKVFQEGKHVFDMQFDRGIVTNMTLPQKH